MCSTFKYHIYRYSYIFIIATLIIVVFHINTMLIVCCLASITQIKRSSNKQPLELNPNNIIQYEYLHQLHHTP